jgi:hypothetical protein
MWGYTSRPNHRLFIRQAGDWYLIDFARSRHANPARIPVSPMGCWYYRPMAGWETTIANSLRRETDVI